jgi:prepilin-type N-terminal cleavage/methylation domain-containing protein
MKYSRFKAHSGFTLLELMVVITIIGLLATVILAALATSRSTARDATRVSSVKELQKALELYRNQNGGSYPCATAMPACAGNAAAGVAVNASTSNLMTAAITAYFQPRAEAVLASVAVAGSASLTSSAASILYRVGSTAGNETSPDRSTYTILLRREQDDGPIPANTWCSISNGTGHSAWNNSTAGQYPSCF